MLFFALCSLGQEKFGYSDCVVLNNQNTQVIITGALGCRVLEFSRNGKNALLTNLRHNGVQWTSGPKPFEPSGGRFDIGPELNAPPHEKIRLGTWHCKESTGQTSVWQSPLSEKKDFEVQRKFELDSKRSLLRITQTVWNRSPVSLRLQHWGRGWFRPDGEVIIPLRPEKLRRFPKGYVQYLTGSQGWQVQLLPEDPAFSIQGNFLLVKPLPHFSKNSMECGEPWSAYRMPKSDLLLIQRFPIKLTAAQPEIVGGNFNICFNKWFCEMEPLGPEELVQPGKSFSFTEEWELVDGAEMSLENIRNLAKKISCRKMMRWQRITEI
jgi:hypothetical protein